MFRNLKIAPKLILCFIISVLISSLSGAIGIALLINSDNDYSTALIQNGFSQGEIGTFNTYLNKGAAVVRDIVLLTEPSDIQESQTELEEIKIKTDSALEQLKVNCQTEEELKYIAIIDQKLPQYRTLREQVVSLGLQNRNDEALALFRTEARPILNEVMQAAEGLADYNEDLGYKASDHLTAQSRGAIISMLAVMLISLIICVVFAIIIAKSIANPIIQVQNAALQLSKGDLNIHISSSSRDEVGQMTQSFAQAADMMRRYISDIKNGLSEVSKGNFRIQPNEQYQGDFIEIENAIQMIITSLSETLGQIDQAAEQVSGGSDQVSNGAQALSQGSTEQASAVEELAATINDISSQVQGTAENAKSASEKADTVGQDMMLSNNQMKQMIEAIHDISSSSNEIGKIIKTIEDIAFQTNILALNAAVEAARAGTAGKGFAVVADEVRNLASKSADASKNTASLIENSIRSVEHGTQIADNTAQVLSKAVEGVQDVVSLVGKITEATVEQANSLSQVTQGIDQISSVVQTNSATAEESAAASEELSGQAQILKDLVGQFQLFDLQQSTSQIPQL